MKLFLTFAHFFDFEFEFKFFMNTIHSVSNTSRMRSSEAVAVRNSFSLRSLVMRVMLVMAIVVGGKVAWGQVVSGTTYETKNSVPSGWSKNGDFQNSAYLKLISSYNYIQTSSFCQNGFTRIVLKARKFGGPSNEQALITVSWYDATTSAETVLGTITPTSTSLSNYTISSPSNPTANTNGYIKIQCKGAGSGKGSGVSEVTIRYTTGTCGSIIPTHTLTYSVNPVGAGTIVLSSTTVAEGSTATATATPNTGYAFDHWSISGTDASLSSTSENHTTVTMGTSNATVTAHFTEILHTVEFDYGNGRCSTFPAITELTESSPNSGVVLPSALPHSYCTEYEFLGWATSEATGTSASPNIVGIAGDTYHPSGDITLYAVYASYSGDYIKIDEDLANWSGKYLIVYETGNKAFDGSLETLDVTNNYIDITITSSTIVSNTTTDASSFTIVQSGENCTIKSNSGYYIGQTSDANGLLSQSSIAYTNDISYYAYGGSIDVLSSGGAYLRFNYASNQMRFRYYKSDTFTGQQPIQLYRKSATFNTNPNCPAPSSLTITYEPNGTSVTGSVTDDNTYGYNDPVTVLNGDGFVNEGYAFAGWNTAANGYGDNYDVGDVFYITENITLYAQWAPKVYSVTWYANGSAVESLPIHYGNSFLDEDYELDDLAYIDDDADGNACDDMHIVGWYESEFEEFVGTPVLLQYTDIASIIATGNKNYYAVFANGDAPKWTLVDDVSELEAGDDIVIVSGTKALGTTQNGNNRNAVDITNNLSTVEIGDDVQIIKLEDGTVDGTFGFYVGNGYLYAASSNSNYLRTQASLDANASWRVTISVGETAVVAQGSNTRNNLRYNSTNDIFSCYSSGQTAVSIYKKTSSYSNFTTFCPCDYDIDNISNGDMVWAGKNGPTNDWNLASNWVVYRSSDHEYHLAAEAPTSGNVFIKRINDGDGCIINVKPNLTSDVTCNNLKLDGIDIDIAENKSLTINGTATFTSGIINGNVVFGEDAIVIGTGTSSHVDGVVTKNGAANGFTFPTGSNGNLGKVVVTGGTATNVSVQYFSNPSGFGTNDLPRWWASASVSGFDHVSNVEYWRISSPEAITANFVAVASTDMHFNSATAEEDKIPTNIQMAFYDNNRWTNVGGSASIDGNTLSINGAEIPASATRGISGNYTTFGSKSKSTILPIELLSFSATCNGKSSLIEWTTATEKNNDFFVLERSTDAINFKEIARVAGAGNTIEPNNYAYTDYGARSGDNYYRLVQVDYDGTSTASEIIVANCPTETLGEPNVLAFPNPFEDNLTLHFENFGNIQATVEVYDMLGRMVHTQKVNCSQNDYEIILRLAGLSDGTYNVRISTKELVINRQVIKN